MGYVNKSAQSRTDKEVPEFQRSYVTEPIVGRATQRSVLIGAEEFSDRRSFVEQAFLQALGRLRSPRLELDDLVK